MLCKFALFNPSQWPKGLPLLFAVLEVPQASFGFSAFELLYGQKPRGVMNMLREEWDVLKTDVSVCPNEFGAGSTMTKGEI